MITALDTSAVIDVLTGDPDFGPASLRAVRRCRREGKLVATEAVWAEVASGYRRDDAARGALSAFGLSYSPMTRAAALRAGALWRRYRERGGQRARIVSDFLIGAHALAQADRLLTRDHGFFRTYFEDLTVLDPGEE